VTKIQKGKEKG